MFVNDKIVIYINVRKDKSTTKQSRDATKCILGGSRNFPFSFSYLEYFFVKWNGNFFEARFVFWIFRIMKFSEVEVSRYSNWLKIYF